MNAKNGNTSEVTSRLLTEVESDEMNGLPPCVDGIGPMTFFNDAKVKKALHVSEVINLYFNIK